VLHQSILLWSPEKIQKSPVEFKIWKYTALNTGEMAQVLTES